MIDLKTRQRFAEEKKSNTLVQGMKESIASALKQGNPNEEVLKLVVKREEEQQLLDIMSKIGSALALIYKAVSKPIILPKIFQIKGQVEVTRQSSVEVKNLDELSKYFKSLEQKLTTWAQAASTATPPVINIPKIEIPKFNSTIPSELIDTMQSINDKLDKIQPQEFKFPKQINVGNFPPTMVPQPVTNININPLQGVVKTSATTVGITLTTLPGYGQLSNRRALVVYNNSANTIYVGGSDVTVSSGIPVSSNSFSQVFDSGYNQILYGIASQNGNNVRVLEVASRSEPYISEQG